MSASEKERGRLQVVQLGTLLTTGSHYTEAGLPA
jgi:hypothetical protein